MQTLASANYTEFKKLQSFTNKETMDLAIRKFLYTYGHKLTEGAKKVLKVLRQHACKIAGVAWMKYKTLADLAEISVPTAKRAIKLLETFGVIDKKTTIRVEGKHRGGNGHNVYVIQSVEGVKELPETNNDTPLDTPTVDTPPKADKQRKTGVGKQKKTTETKSFKTMPSKEKNKKNSNNSFFNFKKTKPQQPKINVASNSVVEAKKADLENQKTRAVHHDQMPKHMTDKPEIKTRTQREMDELRASILAGICK